VTPAPLFAFLVLWPGALWAGGSLGDSRLVTESQAVAPTENPGLSSSSDPTSVKKALAGRDYPWYDRQADRVRPVWPTRWSWLKWLGDQLDRILKAIGRFFDRFKFSSGLGISGNSLGTVLLLAVLVAFLVGLLLLWLRVGSSALDGRSDRERLGLAARLAQLPEGIRPGGDDPWAEAEKRRAAGDLAGAVVCVFAHQLLALDREGLIRLVPGRTGRQYVHGLRDPELLDVLGGTLGLFEAVYYGQRRPSADLFERVWSRAEAFRQRHGLAGES
jgi:hypothetical protein